MHGLGTMWHIHPQALSPRQCCAHIPIGPDQLAAVDDVVWSSSDDEVWEAHWAEDGAQCKCSQEYAAPECVALWVEQGHRHYAGTKGHHARMHHPTQHPASEMVPASGMHSGGGR